MKKKFNWLAALFAVMMLVLGNGCEQSPDSSGGNGATTDEENNTTPTVPEGFVLIQSGTFTMGGESGYVISKPAHSVTLTRSFYMSKYELTQKEYEEIMGSNPSYFDSNPAEGEVQENRPVENVSWYDALVYCNKRSIQEGLTPCYTISNETDPSKWGTVPTSDDSTWDAVVCDFDANGYRLPTEAEWEFAARAGDTTTENKTWSGTTIETSLGDYAWYLTNSDSKTHEVGKKQLNAWGLYDMSGNVWEWCWDLYSGNYESDKNGATDPTGPSSGWYRVGRGGSWSSGGTQDCSVAFRSFSSPSYRYYNLGFRLVRSAK